MDGCGEGRGGGFHWNLAREVLEQRAANTAEIGAASATINQDTVVSLRLPGAPKHTGAGWSWSSSRSGRSSLGCIHEREAVLGTGAGWIAEGRAKAGVSVVTGVNHSPLEDLLGGQETRS